MKRYLYILFISVFLVACKENNNKGFRRFDYSIDASSMDILTMNNKSVVNIDIEAPKMYDIDKIISSIKYIPLQTNKNSLIGIIMDVSFFQNKIFVLSRESQKINTISVFDEKGHFIKKINNFGEGPDDYLSISDMMIDEHNNRFCVFDDIKREVNYYDLEKIEKIGATKTNFRVNRFLPIGGNNYISILRDDASSNTHLSNIGEYKVVLSDSVFNILKKGYEHKYNPSDNFMNINQLFSWQKDSINYAPKYVDTIYRVTKDNIIAKYALNYHYGNVPSKDFFLSSSNYSSMKKEIKDRNYLYFVGENFETKDFLQIGYYRGNEYMRVFYNKNTGNTLSVNNFTGDQNKVMLFQRPAVSSISDGFITVLDCGYLHEYALKMKENNYALSSDISDLLNKVDDDDNPILIFYKLKDF